VPCLHIFLAYFSATISLGRGAHNIQVLLADPLADPRWEARLLHFLELSGVGREVDEVDEEEIRDARLDNCIVWEAEERVAE